MRIRRLADGQVFEGPDGTPIPDGFEIEAIERTPPSNKTAMPMGDDNPNLGAGELYEATGGMPGGGPADIAKLKRLAAQVARYGPAVLGPTGGLVGLLAGAVLSGAGSLAGDAIEGLPPSLGSAAGAMGGHLAGAGLGKALEAGLPPVIHMASKLRPRGLSGPLEKYAQQDAAMVGQAIGEAVPPLQGAASVEDLQKLMRGGEGKKAIQDSYGRSLDDLKAALTRNEADQGYSVYVGSDAKKVEELLDELAGKGAKAYTQKGNLRDNAGTLGALRDRREILDDIKALLPEDLWPQFQAAQKQYGAGKELLRWFKEQGRTAHAIGPRGLNMSELQRVAGDREGEMAGRVSSEQLDALMRALFRGGRPPMTDREVAIPLSKTGGQLRLPLLMDYLAGPGVRVNLSPYASRTGAGLGASLGRGPGR